MEVTIPNTPSLAAFSWTTSTTELFILGGSDGSLLNSDLFIVDFLNGTCKFVSTDFEFSTGMGHLIYREKADELHHIGGFNSYGVNYSMKLGSNKWQALKSLHSNVTSGSELELTSNTSVYF